MGKGTQINNALKFIKEHIKSPWAGHIDFAVWLVKKMNPSIIVDLGYGCSTFAFASLKIGKVYGIDWFLGDSFDGGRRNYDSILNFAEVLEKRFGVYNLEIVKGKFSDIAEIWKIPIDILHIDGSHFYDDVKRDFGEWSKFVKKDGVILFHDVHVPYNSKYEGVKKFFDEIDLPKFMFTHSFGLGVISQNKDLIEEIKNYAQKRET